MTAVDWLVSQLNKQGFAQVVTDEEIQIAKAMEKDQILDALEIGENCWDAEQYYNEKYGKEKGNNKHAIQKDN